MNNLFPVNFKHYIEIGVFALVALIFTFINFTIGCLLWHVVAFVAWSLRSRIRPFSASQEHYLSPVDGRIVAVNKSCTRGDKEYVLVTIETGAFDSHAQYAPIGGALATPEITKRASEIAIFGYKLDFLSPIIHDRIMTTKIADKNSKAECIVETDVQVIIPSPFGAIEPVEYESGFVDQGNRIGLWHASVCGEFLTNVYLPIGTALDVEPGQKTIGGQTILGYTNVKQIELEIVEPEPNKPEENVSEEEKDFVIVG